MDPQKQPTNPPDERQEFHPDMTISPRNPQPAATPAAPAGTTVAPSATPPAQTANASAAAAAEVASDHAPALPPADPEERQFYRPEDDNPSAGQPAAPTAAVPAVQPQAYGPQMQDTGSAIAWTASEFIVHEKSAAWYLVLGGGGLLLMGIVYLLSRDIFATIVVAMVVALFWAGAVRQPRQMHYELDAQGLQVNNRHYAYGNFRSFAIADEGPFKSINFMPLQRFLPLMSVYYDPADETRITEVLAAHLPRETHKLDAVEKLMRRIRF